MSNKLFNCSYHSIILIILPMLNAIPVYFEDCGNGEIKLIDIEPCRSLPCHFDAGARANLTIVFEPTQEADYLILYGTLRTGGIFNYEIKAQDEDPELCKSPGKNTWGKIDCPVMAGRRYTFKASRLFPASTTWNVFRYSKIKVLDAYGRTIACADWHLQFNRAETLKQKL